MKFQPVSKFGAPKKPSAKTDEQTRTRKPKEDYTDSKFFDSKKTTKTSATGGLKKAKDSKEKPARKKSSLSAGRDTDSRSSPHFNANSDKPRRKKVKSPEEDQAPWDDDAPDTADLAPARPLRDLTKTKALPAPAVETRTVMHVDQSQAGLVSPEAKQALESRFGVKADLIVDLIETDNTDGATTLIFKTLLQSLVEVLPITEHAVRKSQGSRGVYQFNQVVSQMRELLADIQSVRDRGLLGNSVVERHVRPAFMDIAVQIVQAMTNIEESARTRMSPEDFKFFRESVIQDSKKALANYIQRQYAEVAEAVVTSLS